MQKQPQHAPLAMPYLMVRGAADAIEFYKKVLGGATPQEVFLGFQPAHLRALHPLRGRLGEPTARLPIEIVYLDEECRLPYLVRTDAA